MNNERNERENVGAVGGSKSRKRGPTDDQKKSLINFLEQNLWVARNQFQSPDGTGDLKQKWEEATRMLNMMGGAHKNAAEWKKCWADIKSAVKKRYVGVKARMLESGINGSFIEEMDEMDQRIVGIISIESLEGDGSREHGPTAPTQRGPVLRENNIGSPGPSNGPLLPSAPSPHNASSDSSPIREPERPTAHPAPHNSRKRPKENEEIVLFRELLEIKKRKLEILEADNLKRMEDDRMKEDHVLKLELMRAKLEMLRKQL